MKSLLPQPYNIHYASGYYSFHTDSNFTYSCAFQDLTPLLPPLVGIYDIQVSDFSFELYDPQPEKEKPNDPRVAATIGYLLNQYFDNKNCALIYVCDMGDGRHRERQRLFQQWHRSMGDLFSYDALEIDIKGETLCGGILTRKDFPYPDILKGHVTNTATGFIVEKFGP